MFGTTHHAAFDNWWEYAAENYVTWDGGSPVSMDLYYDPIVDQHLQAGPVGLMVPAWYFAPQRADVAAAGWQMNALRHGVAGETITGLEDPASATLLLQCAGEFADAETKERIWSAAEAHIEPTWDRESGEFSLGFQLNEPHPRGQWNARSMAGWVCTQGAWSRLFNQPNLAKFDQPTIEGVDFPRVALSQASWDGTALHIAAQPQNKHRAGQLTSMRITNLNVSRGWVMTEADGQSVPLAAKGDHVVVELIADNRPVAIRQQNP